MKKLWIVIALFLLCGCGAEETFETVADEMVLEVLAQPREILLTLPEETLLPAMESDGCTIYLCSGYDVAVQTFSSGDLNATVQQLCGFDSSELTIMETMAGEKAGCAGMHIFRQHCTVLIQQSLHHLSPADTDA